MKKIFSLSKKTAQTEETNNPAKTEMESTVEVGDKPKKKFSKKEIRIIGAIIAVVAIVVVISLIPSKLERVGNKCVDITGAVPALNDDYFTLETQVPEGFPSSMAVDYQDRVLEAIKYANEELGFPSLYSEMLNTTALMGRQTEENNKYKVSWTYHPDDGLKVTYMKK